MSKRAELALALRAMMHSLAAATQYALLFQRGNEPRASPRLAEFCNSLYDLSQTLFHRCWYSVSAASGAIDPVEIQADSFDFEAFFHAHYERIARVIARVVGDQGRAEDLAAEALWKLWRTPRAQGGNAGGWLYRTAVRMGLNELRNGRRRLQYESLAGEPPRLPTPEEAHAAAEERAQVRRILAALQDRQAELLILRSSGLTYDELAAALGLNPASVGTLVARAQQAFRKEYLKQYGTRRNGR